VLENMKAVVKGRVGDYAILYSVRAVRYSAARGRIKGWIGVRVRVGLQVWFGGEVWVWV
jgi:hypothetical protein